MSRSAILLGAVLLMVTSCSHVEDVKTSVPVQTEADLFVGTWELVSFEWRSSEGGSVPVEFIGRINYDANGKMAAQGMVQNRLSFTSTQLWDWTPEEADSAFRTYFAYFGDFRVDTDKKEVIHITHADLKPSNVGLEKVRNYGFDSDNELVLSTPPFQLATDENQWPEYLKPLFGSEELYVEVKWRRVQ